MSSSSKTPSKLSNDDVVPTVVQGHTFTVSPRYSLVDSHILGKGSYGVVCTALDTLTGNKIAIKRIRPFANDEWDARHTLREIRLLKVLGNHPNIITLYNLSLYESKTELYMYMELMEKDLHYIIQSKQTLSDMHFQCFAKQMLEGIKAMHSVGIFHRDLKPGNILVSKDCQLRITDFGLARFMDDTTLAGNNDVNPQTEYVVTRWYRCPELLLAPKEPYSEAIDMWSIGCILAELMRRRPIFPGKSHANQVQLIFEVRGFSKLSDVGFTVSDEAASFLTKRCQYKEQPLRTIIPQATEQALELIETLLAINPKKRPSAEAALKFEYLKDADFFHDYSVTYVNPPAKEIFDFENEKFNLSTLKKMIMKETELSSVVPSVQSPPEEIRINRISSKSDSNSPTKDNITTSSNESNPESELFKSQKQIEKSNPLQSKLVDKYLKKSINDNKTDTESNNITKSTNAINDGSQYKHVRRHSFHHDAQPDSSETEGPASQLKTHAQGGRNPTKLAADQSTPNPGQSNLKDTKTINNNDKHPIQEINRISSGLSNKSNSTKSHQSTPVGSPRSQKTKLKSPSPQKIETIVSKSAKMKRRFVIEGLQQQRNEDEVDCVASARDSITTARSTDNTKPARPSSTPAGSTNTSTGIASTTNIKSFGLGSILPGKFPLAGRLTRSQTKAQTQIDNSSLSASNNGSGRPPGLPLGNGIGTFLQNSFGRYSSLSARNNSTNLIPTNTNTNTNNEDIIRTTRLSSKITQQSVISQRSNSGSLLPSLTSRKSNNI